MPQEQTADARRVASGKLSVLRKHPYFADLSPEAFEQLVRILLHQNAIVERAGLALVRINGQVNRPLMVLRQEAPLHG